MLRHHLCFPWITKALCHALSRTVTQSFKRVSLCLPLAHGEEPAPTLHPEARRSPRLRVLTAPPLPGHGPCTHAGAWAEQPLVIPVTPLSFTRHVPLSSQRVKTLTLLHNESSFCLKNKVPSRIDTYY